MTNSIHDIIEKRIGALKKGSVIFPGDFKGLGDEAAINMALSRLNKKKVIARLAHGIYLVPKVDVQLGILYPSLDQVAEAVARRDHARIRPTGPYALHKLGLSTQVPMKIVYLTDGAPRKIRLGKGSIMFKATTPKKLMLKGPISSLIVQAFEELGQDKVTTDIIKHVRKLLEKENPQFIKHDMNLAPAWIRKIFTDITITSHNDSAIIFN